MRVLLVISCSSIIKWFLLKYFIFSLLKKENSPPSISIKKKDFFNSCSFMLLLIDVKFPSPKIFILFSILFSIEFIFKIS
jgi:hypothetical protein